MQFNAEHKALNTNLYQFKKYSSQRTQTEFSKTNCKNLTLALSNATHQQH